MMKRQWGKYFMQVSEKTSSLAALAAIFAAVALSFSPIFVRASAIDPIATGFFRFFIALPFLWGWMVTDKLRQPHHQMPKSAQDYILLLGSGVFLAADIIFWHWSLQHTSVVNSTLFNNMTTIFVVFFGWLLFKERLSWGVLGGIAVALAGVFVMIGSDLLKGQGSLHGDLLALLSAVLYACYIMVVKKLRHTFQTPTILAWSALSSVYIMAVVSFTGETRIIPVTWQGWGVVLGLAFIVHLLGQGTMAYAMRHISAALSSVILTLVPFMSALMAWILFGEKVTLTKMMGGALVLGGIIITRRQERALEKRIARVS